MKIKCINDSKFKFSSSSFIKIFFSFFVLIPNSLQTFINCSYSIIFDIFIFSLSSSVSNTISKHLSFFIKLITSSYSSKNFFNEINFCVQPLKLFSL